MQKAKCRYCEENEGQNTRFGLLCPACLSGVEAEEELERLKAKAQAEAIATDKWHSWEPSIAYVLLAKELLHATSNVVSPDKLPDIHNRLSPLVHTMPIEDVNRMFLSIKEAYFMLQSELHNRPVQAFREAEVIKRQTKGAKTTERATKEIAKQKKHASHDRTLSKEDRGFATLREGLERAGIPEAEIARIVAESKAKMVKK